MKYLTKRGRKSSHFRKNRMRGGGLNLEDISTHLFEIKRKLIDLYVELDKHKLLGREVKLDFDQLLFAIDNLARNELKKPTAVAAGKRNDANYIARLLLTALAGREQPKNQEADLTRKSDFIEQLLRVIEAKDKRLSNQEVEIARLSRRSDESTHEAYTRLHRTARTRHSPRKSPIIASPQRKSPITRPRQGLNSLSVAVARGITAAAELGRG